MDLFPTKRRKMSTASATGMSEGDGLADGVIGSSHVVGKSSFVSPTKANLARFNPQLLPSKGSGTLPWRRNSVGQLGLNHDSRVELHFEEGVRRPPRARSYAPCTPQCHATLVNGKSYEDFPSSMSKRKMQDTRNVNTTPKKPRISPNFNARASSPEQLIENNSEMGIPSSQLELTKESGGVSDLQEADKPLKKSNGLQIPSTPIRSSVFGTTSGMNIGEDGEPSLPSTPVQLGLERSPAYRQGLSLSSPRKRLARAKIAGTSQSSPLKPKDAASLVLEKSTPATVANLGPRMYVVHTPRPPPPASESVYHNMQRRLATLEEQLKRLAATLLHQVLIFGEQDQQGRRDRTLRNITNQKNEILIMNSKVHRSRKEIRRYAMENMVSLEAQATHGGVPTPLNSSASPRQLARFLPFSGKYTNLSSDLVLQQQRGTSQPSSLGIFDDNGSTLLNINSSDTYLIDHMPEDTVIAIQVISFWLPSQTFHCKVRVTVNAASLQIEGLEVLDLSPWAELELGAWLRSQSRDKNLLTLGQSVRGYWTACRQRLACINEAAQGFGDLFVNSTDFGSLLPPPAELEEDAPNAHNKRHTLTFARDGVSLHIDWQITINDEGQPTDSIIAHPAFPKAWQQTEFATEFGKVRKAFDSLLRRNGVAQALQAITGLLFPTQHSWLGPGSDG